MTKTNTAVSAIWFTRTGAGPDWFNLELHPFPSEDFEGRTIPASLGLRVRLASRLALVTTEIADGGFQLDRSEVEKLHDQLGAWLRENPPASTAQRMADAVMKAFEE